MAKKGDDGGFGKFLYNSETGEFLGRTGMSWLKIIVFYIIFYAALAAFFALLLWVFYMTLSHDQPKYILGASLIGTNPGVGFRPQPDQDSNVDSTLIWFKKHDKKDYQFWSNQLANFSQDVQDQRALQNTDLINNCQFGGETTAKSKGDKACKLPPIDQAKFGPCTESNEFGYGLGSPCVLIKLNRIYGWEPEPMVSFEYREKLQYSGKRIQFSMDQFSLGLADRVAAKQISQDYANDTLKRVQDMEKISQPQAAELASSVWIYCDGENPADRENMGKLTYHPNPYIPSYYFPYKKQDHYVSPFIMVHFEKPTSGVLINIECKALANNIIPDRQMRAGSVHFEVMVE